MRQAPPVGVTATGGLAWQAAQSLLAAAAAAALGAWLLQHAGQPPWLAPALGAGVGALAWRAARPRARQLRWDGQRWSLDGLPCRVAPMLDPGPLLLLRWQAEGGARGWLAVGRHEAGHDWPALRAALYSPAAARTPAPSAPE